MIVQTSLLIAMFHLFKCTTADWDEFNPLILVQKAERANSMQVFPRVVREVNQCKVYIGEGEENSVITYAYCSNPIYGYTYPAGYPNFGHAYCNYYETLRENHLERNLPTQRCDFELNFQMIKKMFSPNVQRTCSHNGRNGLKYQFVYWLCRYGIKENTSLRIYELCYDDDKMQAIIGKYTIFAPDLLANDLLSNEQSIQFDFDTSHFVDNNTQRILVRSHQLYNQESYLFSESIHYVPRLILPSEWLEFAPRRKPLFHYMNVAAMNVNLVTAWKTLMMNIKPKLARMNGFIHVQAGLHGIVRDIHKKELHLGSREIPVPKRFWVLIYNGDHSRGVAIAMDNELLHSSQQSYLHPDCSLEVCDIAQLRTALPPSVPNGYNPNIYCCPPRIISEMFDFRRGGNYILELP